MSIGLFNKLRLRSFYQSLIILGTFEVVLFKIVSPQWWRQAITGFPSWMFRYANTAEDKTIGLLEQTTTAIQAYFANLFEPSWAAFIVFTALLLLSVITLTKQILFWPGVDRTRTCTSEEPLLPTNWAWLLCWFSLIASSQRIAPRYEIYILIPVLITAGSCLTRYCEQREYQKRQLTPSIAALCSSFLILTAGLSSATNAKDLNSFINAGQPRDVLCIGHHMDRTMELTSAGRCKVFAKGARDKDAYDSWDGPR
jgi:hypothetical protein